MDDDTDSRQVLSIAVLEPDLHVAGHWVPGSGQRSVAMKGSLCTQSAAIVAADLHRWLDGAPGEETAVDLADVQFIDARGLSLLISLRHRASLGGRSLSIVRTSEAVDRLLGMCGLGELVDGPSNPDLAGAARRAGTPVRPTASGVRAPVVSRRAVPAGAAT